MKHTPRHWTQHRMHTTQDHVSPRELLASQAAERLRPLVHKSALERQRAVQRIATDEGWDFWLLGGFCFPDSSVLRCEGSGWHALNPEEARAHLHAQMERPLEVLLLHAFTGLDERGKRSISQARFERLEPEGWRLTVGYEAFMDSPLYDFQADTFAALLELPLCALRVDTPHPSARWRLEQIALCPDWLELLTVSSAPDFRHLRAATAAEPRP